MSNNRVLDGLNWQERSDGAWYAETKNYRLLVFKQDAKDIVDYAKDYHYQAVVYKWHENENAWIFVKKPMWGVKGTMENAKLQAEEMLSSHLAQEERRLDPGKATFDALERIIGDAQLRQMDAERTIAEMQQRGNDPRSRMLPPGHPDIFRR